MDYFSTAVQTLAKGPNSQELKIPDIKDEKILLLKLWDEDVINQSEIEKFLQPSIVEFIKNNLPMNFI